MCCIRRKRECDNFVNKKLDRRKRYTRMVLRDNLMLLLKKKQLSSITVKELCEKADINRSTFYDHFKDVFHLMDYIEEEIIVDLTTYLGQYNFAEGTEESLQMTEKLLEYIASKRSEEHTSELQSRGHLVCRLLLEQTKIIIS